MNRNSLFGRFAASGNANRTTKLLDYLKVHIEPLEDRKLLASQVVYVNDNWIMNTPGVLANLSSVKDPTSGITRTYGADAFGLVTSGVSSDSTGGIYATISSAIDPAKVNSTGGTVSILDGTYTESDIIVDMNVIVKGVANAGASQTLITPGINSTPTIDGNGIVAPLGTNSHSGFLIYSPTVTISQIHIDGGAGLNYQHGITTIYQANNGANTGTYSAVSFTGATPVLLPTIQLNGLTPTASPGTTPNTHVSISIDSNVVENTYYHGITLSARKNENIENQVANNPITAGPRITNNVVRNVGAFADRDYQRVGISFNNVFEAYSTGNQVSNVGTGWALTVWNDTTFGAWGNRSAGGAAGFGAPLDGTSPMTQNTVTDAKTRGYEINFTSAGGTAALNNIYNTSNANLATNTTVGLYINQTAMLLRGWKITGAYIGVEVQNTTRVNPLSPGTGSARYPTFTTDFYINGPLVANAPRAGSYGILAQSGAGFSNPAVVESNEVAFEATAGDTITNYDTSIKIAHSNAPNTRTAEVVLDRLVATNANTGLVLGDNVQVTGQWSMNEGIIVTGVNSSFFPGYGAPGYINSRSPSVTPPFPPTTATTSAPAASSTAATGGMPGTILTNNLTLNSGSTFSVSFSGLPASTLLDDFSANVPFSSTPQSGISPWRTNGFRVAGIRGPSWQTAGVITQNGTSGVLKIRPNDPGNAVAGATEVINGYAYHLNMDPSNGVWTTVNASGFETMEISLRLPNNLSVSGNGSLTDGFSNINSDSGMRVVRIGLLDIDNTGRGFAIPTRLLSSTAFTTIRVNLGGPNVTPNGLTPIGSGSFGDSDLNFNLGELAGFYVIRENVSGDANTPFGIVIDRISLLRATGVDQFAVNGNVTLGSATLAGTGNADFTPTVGQQFTVIDNQGSNPVNGKFVDGIGNVINEGGIVTFGDKYSLSYVGGTGNDVVLTVVNDTAPTLDLNTTTGGVDTTATYTGLFSQVPATVMPSATIADVDDTLINSVFVDLERNIGSSDTPNLVTGDHLIVNLPLTTILDNPGDAEDRFSINGTQIEAIYSRTTGVLSLTGQDTIAHYVNALRAVQYFNNGPYGPMGGTRTAVITVNNSKSATANLTINVDPTNAIPIVDLNGVTAGVDNTITYTNGQVIVSGKVNVSPSANITDSDSPSLFGININVDQDADPGDGVATVVGDYLRVDPGAFTLTLFNDHESEEGDADTDNENSNDDEYRVTGAGIASSITILSTYDSSTGQLTLQGLASLSVYQSLLRSVQYYYSYKYHDPSDVSPANDLDHSGITGLGAPQRFILVTAYDGVSQGGEANVVINGDLTNVEPEIDMDVNTIGLQYYQQMTITGNSPPFAVMNVGDQATLSDADDATLLAVRISTGSSGATEIMTVNTGGTSISSAYVITGGIGQMTLYGQDTVANYLAVLNTLTWQETANASPNFSARSFTVRVFDGASYPAAQAWIEFDQLYDPPTTPVPQNPDPYIDLNGTFASNGGSNGNGNLVTYTGGAIALSTPNAVLDNPQYEPDVYRLTAQIITTGANGGSSVSAGDVLDVPNAALAGTFIQKSYNSATGTLTLTGWATTEAYNAALLAITYDNTVDGALPTQKMVKFLVTDTVQTNDGLNPLGTLAAAPPATATISLAVGASTVVNKFLFYNQSSFDGNNINVTTTGALNDDTAIAPDKTSYLQGSGAMSMAGATFPNSPQSFRSVSSFTRGINGLMVDITGLHPSITVSDFVFKVGNNNSPSTWGFAPNPTSVTIRTTGTSLAGGNTRVEIIWPNNSIRNTWLEVQVKANGNTGLADNAQLPNADGIGHTFFYGSRVGDSGSGDTASFLTTATDEIGARNNPGSGQPITNRFDYNKDGLVTATDQITSRNNAGSIAFLNMADPPLAPPAAPASLSDGNGVASALSASSGAGGGGGAAGWIANRLASVDLNSGPVARLFEHLAEKNTPRAQKILVAADHIADDLGLDHELLDSILADLGLE